MQQTQTSLIKSPKFATNKNITPKAKTRPSASSSTKWVTSKIGAEFWGPSHQLWNTQPASTDSSQPQNFWSSHDEETFDKGGGSQHQQTRTQQKKKNAPRRGLNVIFKTSLQKCSKSTQKRHRSLRPLGAPNVVLPMPRSSLAPQSLSDQAKVTPLSHSLGGKPKTISKAHVNLQKLPWVDEGRYIFWFCELAFGANLGQKICFKVSWK